MRRPEAPTSGGRRLRRAGVLVPAAAAFLGLGQASAVAGEDLRDALALAYQTNPVLLAQRANQRALDELIVQARAGLRPSLDLSATANYSRSDSAGGTRLVDTDGDGLPDTSVNLGGVVETEAGGLSLGLSQILYSGGRIAHGVTAAEAEILAGRERLRAVEQQVLASVIQAYADVLRDLEILRVRQENIAVLRRQLDEASARFEVGEITRTDVAQSEARLAQSQADLANAQAQLSVSRAAYAAVVGQAPADLEPLPVLPACPPTSTAPSMWRWSPIPICAAPPMPSGRPRPGWPGRAPNSSPRFA